MLNTHFKHHADSIVRTPTGEEAKVAEVIRRGIQQGRRRAPRAVDVFVHPEFPFSPDVDTEYLDQALYARQVPNRERVISDARSAFAEQIGKQLSTGADYIVIKYAGAEADYHYGYDQARAVESWHPNSGMVSRAELPRLIDLLDGINPQDKVRLHGANFAQCPTRAAEQLFGLICLSQFYGPEYPVQWDQDTTVETAIGGHEPQMMRPLIVGGSLFAKSNFRLGTVFDGMGFAAVGSINPRDINTQLTDEHTAVYPAIQ